MLHAVRSDERPNFDKNLRELQLTHHVLEERTYILKLAYAPKKDFRNDKLFHILRSLT